MESKQLVRRIKDENDGRKTLVEIDSPGRRLAHLRNFDADINEILLTSISSRERAQLQKLLNRVLSNLDDAFQAES